MTVTFHPAGAPSCHAAADDKTREQVRDLCTVPSFGVRGAGRTADAVLEAIVSLLTGDPGSVPLSCGTALRRRSEASPSARWATRVSRSIDAYVIAQQSRGGQHAQRLEGDHLVGTAAQARRSGSSSASPTKAQPAILATPLEPATVAVPLNTAHRSASQPLPYRKCSNPFA
jgi:hypothetical protein